jgi:D-cysteine desulfhydrase family pyridoxal phosphate-dependent enzyme
MQDRMNVRALERLMEFPHLECGYYPTPLVELDRLRTHLGRGPRIFLKHDDQTGPIFGGNKVRKLEYVLAQALADGADVIITVGSEQSNHARITATLGARLGLRTILVLNPAADHTGGLKAASLMVDELFGAETHLVHTREERAPTMQRIANELRFAGKRVVEIPIGASVPLGALGYVRAVQEAALQMGDTASRVTHIFSASSSGGTQAGIAVGSRLAGLRARVIGVSPDDSSLSIASEVKNIISGVEALLEMTGEPPTVEVLDQYVGPSYGIPSKESERALQLLARVEGILLDPVYTAKAMAALLAWIDEGQLDENHTVLFWHTGGQLALFGASQGT